MGGEVEIRRLAIFGYSGVMTENIYYLSLRNFQQLTQNIICVTLKITLPLK